VVEFASLGQVELESVRVSGLAIDGFETTHVGELDELVL
jgi:hypothetical protein